MQIVSAELKRVAVVGLALVMLFAGACVSSSARSAGPRIHDALRNGYENSLGGQGADRHPYAAVLDGAA